MTKELAQPYFSIIVATYNRASFLPTCIESVLNQTYTHWELIIIDDGSTDETKEVVSKYTDERVIYRYQNNSERSSARNNGIRISSGDYCFFLDSDDWYLPNHLQVHADAISESSHPVELTHSWYKNKINSEFEIFPFPEVDQKNFKLDIANFPLLPCICFHKKILAEFKFDQNLSIGEDTELFLRIISKFPYRLINEITFVYNHHGDNSVYDYSISYLHKIEASWTLIYSNHRKYFGTDFFKLKLSNIYSGLADKYSKQGSRIKALKYLFKAVLQTPELITSRVFLGIIRNCIFIAPNSNNFLHTF